MKPLALAFALLLWLAPASSAHPLAELEFDRTIAVRLDPKGVFVTYVARMTPASSVLDGNRCFGAEMLPGVTDGRKHAERYATLKAGQVVGSMVAQLDGKALVFRLDEARKPNIIPTYEEDGQLRVELHLRADWVIVPQREHQFQFIDWTPFANKGAVAEAADVPGRVSLTIDALKKPGELDVDAEQPDRFRDKPLAELPPGQDLARRTCSATFVYHPVAAVTPGAPVAPSEAPGTADVAPVTDARKLNGNLDPLLNSNTGLLAALFLAMLFGAGHAFTPGHGKTMVAAYLIGERGTPKHAVILGLTATIAHTGSVILLAVILYFAYGNVAPESAQAWLNVAGGLFLFLVGFWLFVQRIRGRADHVHLFSGHDHHHHGPNGHHHHGPDCNHDHDHHHGPTELPATSFGWWRVILLGVGGGIIPCWDAVGLFLVAMGDGKIGLAIPLLVAFSLGLCAVLILLGLAVVYANRRGAVSFREQRWFRALPVVSAIVLLGLGLWFLSDGFQLLMANGRPAT